MSVPGRSASAVGEPVLRPVPSPADALFEVGDFQLDGPVVRASMRVGERHREADGSLSPGVLGVLIDSVLAYSCLSDPDRWSLTIEMTADVFPAMQEARGVLHAEAQAVHDDGFGGYATGRVWSDDGRLVATCNQLLRFTEGRPSPPEPTPSPPPNRSVPLGRVRDLVGGDDHVDTGVRFLVAPQVQNPLHNLHGGVSMYACERAAARALAASDVPALGTTSLRVTYLRPVPASSPIAFHPTVVHRGRTLTVVDVAGAVDAARPSIIARASAEPRF
jgi:uncharacterized protein (TIGR00369 family)